MTLAELRNYIRTQLDMDEEELPSAVLDSYLSEGFIRMIAMEPRWPFYETDWTVAKVPGTDVVNLPASCDPPGIMTVMDTGNRQRIVQIGMELALDRFAGQVGAPPSYYSIHNTHLHLWPAPALDSSFNYLVMGHRYSTDWVTAGAGSPVDADPRLHILLAHYAIALCYAQQEDEVLEDVYMKRFMAGFDVTHRAICEPRHHRPLIFNGGTPVVPGYAPIEWANPPVAP